MRAPLIKIPVYTQTVLALVLATITGLIVGPEAQILEPITKSVLWVIKTAAMPLLFLAILDTMVRAEFSGKSLAHLLAVSTTNALCAITIALLTINFFKPGVGLPLTSGAANAATKRIQSFTTLEMIGMFFTSPMVIIILTAIGMGVLHQLLLKNASVSLKAKLLRLSDYATQGLELWLKAMKLILLLVPLAVFCAVSGIIGRYGLNIFGSLFYYFAICLLGMFLHVAIVYQSWIVLYGRIQVREFWHQAKEPIVHAFGINSSLATLSLTLDALKRLKVSDRAARLSACIGTNFNNDGILLYQVFTVLCIAQSYGASLPLNEQILIALFSIIPCIGIGGIPEAGLISLSIVLTTFHFPLEGISLLLTVDWFLARCRSAINVVGDIACAVAIDERRPIKS